MTKKEYVLKLLMALEGKWDLAAGLRILVESSTFDANFIDVLQSIFVDAIHTTLDQDQKSKLEQSLSFLKRLQRVELEQRGRDNHDVQDLENMVSAL